MVPLPLPIDVLPRYCSDGIFVEDNARTDGDEALVEILDNSGDDGSRGFGANLSASDNVSGVEIHRNDIGGTLTCNGNEPPANSSGNTARGFYGECEA